LPSPMRRCSAPPPPHDENAADRLLISLEEPELAEALCAHFRRSGFHARPVDGGMIEVDREDAPSPGQARLEIALHLRVWEAVNPDAKVVVVR
jgi:hypothetical protein